MVRGVGELAAFDPTEGLRPEPPARDGEVDLIELGRAIWVKRRWIIAPTLAALAISAVAVNLMTPVYTSEARLLVENRENAYFRPEIDRNTTSDRALVDQEAMTSQVQLVLSRDLAREVVRTFKLTERREFDSGPSLLSQALRLVGLKRDDGRATEERVLRAYFERLRAWSIDKSRVIAIEFESRDPDLAAKVANGIAEAYLGQQQLAKQDATRQAATWLQGEIEKLRARVADAERRADEFRSQANLFVGTNNTQLSSQQLSELNTQLGTARSQKADAESKARLIRDMLAAGRPIEASEVINSELIRRLVEQRATLKAILAEQSSTLLDQHPRIKELRAQITGLEGQIRAEGERLVRAFESDARIAEARVDTLTKSLDQLKQQVADTGEQDVRLRALEREAKAQRDLLESYLARYRDSTARESLAALPADARVISRATPPNLPSFPKKIPIVALVSIATFVLSTGLVASGELFGARAAPAAMRSRRRRFAQPSVGPVVDDGEPESLPAPAAAAEPVDLLAMEELPAERSLSDLVAARGRGLVAVSAANETVDARHIVLELARDLALRGRSVLIDLDGRSAADPMGDAGAAGIAQLVRNTASFGQVIHRDPASPLHVVPIGGPLLPGEDLLGADRLLLALSALEQTYDHVVLAAPEAARLAAARFAARLKFAVVVAPAGWAAAEAEAVYDALTAVGIDDLVAVVEPERPAEADAADSAADGPTAA